MQAGIRTYSSHLFTTAMTTKTLFILVGYATEDEAASVLFVRNEQKRTSMHF